MVLEAPGYGVLAPCRCGHSSCVSGLETPARSVVAATAARAACCCCFCLCYGWAALVAAAGAAATVAAGTAAIAVLSWQH